MKDQNEHIDNIFKRLKDDSFEVPASFMEDLTTRLDQEFPSPTKKGRWFLFLFYIVLASILGVVFVAVVFTSDAKVEHNSSEVLETVSKNTALSETTVKTDIHNQEILTNNKMQSISNENVSMVHFFIEKNQAIKELVASTSTKKPSVSKNNTSKQSPTKELGINGDTSKNHERINVSTATKTKNSGVSTAFNSKNKNAKPKGSTYATNESNPKDDLSDGNSVRNGNASQLENTSTNSNGKENGALISGTKTSNPLQDQELLLALKTPIFLNLDFGLDIPMVPTKGAISQELKNKKPWELDMQLYGGFSQSSIKVKLGELDSTTSPIYKLVAFSPTFGIKSNIFYANINATLGVEYYQSNERFNLKTKTTQLIGIDSSFLGIHIDSIFVDTIYVYDTTNIYQYDPVYDSVINNSTMKNTYSWLSIPLAFGYRFNFNNWSIIPRVGVNLNFGLSKNQGNYPNSNYSTQLHDAVRFNADIMIQTEVRRNFNKFHIFISPYYRGNLSPILKSTPYTISHQSWGINIGAGIKF